MISLILYLRYAMMEPSNSKGAVSMAHIAYVRVSSVDQNEARQIEALEKYGILDCHRKTFAPVKKYVNNV